MADAAGPPAEPRSRDEVSIGALLLVLLAGAAVAVALGGYARVHDPTFEAITTFGFADMLDMKSWLTTIAMALGIVQLVTALRIFGHLGSSPAGRAVGVTHRVSGVLAVLVSLPVAYHCLWALGYGTYDTRVAVHSLLGCVFYGVFVAKMLALRLPRLPGWAVPLLGGSLFAVLVALWWSSSYWYFTQ